MAENEESGENPRVEFTSTELEEVLHKSGEVGFRVFQAMLRSDIGTVMVERLPDDDVTYEFTPLMQADEAPPAFDVDEYRRDLERRHANLTRLAERALQDARGVGLDTTIRLDAASRYRNKAFGIRLALDLLAAMPK